MELFNRDFSHSVSADYAEDIYSADPEMTIFDEIIDSRALPCRMFVFEDEKLSFSGVTKVTAGEFFGLRRQQGNIVMMVFVHEHGGYAIHMMPCPAESTVIHCGYDGRIAGFAVFSKSDFERWRRMTGSSLAFTEDGVLQAVREDSSTEAVLNAVANGEIYEGIFRRPEYACSAGLFLSEDRALRAAQEIARDEGHECIYPESDFTVSHHLKAA